MALLHHLDHVLQAHPYFLWVLHVLRDLFLLEFPGHLRDHFHLFVLQVLGAQFALHLLGVLQVLSLLGIHAVLLVLILLGNLVVLVVQLCQIHHSSQVDQEFQGGHHYHVGQEGPEHPVALFHL